MSTPVVPFDRSCWVGPRVFLAGCYLGDQHIQRLLDLHAGMDHAILTPQLPEIRH